MYLSLFFLILVIICLASLVLRNFFINQYYRHLFGLEEVFNGELDFIHLSKNILQQVILETASMAGIIYWFDEVREEYKLKALSGIPVDQINKVTRELRKTNGILEKVRERPESFIWGKNRQRKTFNSQFPIADYFSMMVVPLLIQKEARGIMVLFKNKTEYGMGNLKLLEAFAPRAAAQLESARLYQLAKETAQENAKLYINLSKLYQKATLDELTGLYNRNFLTQRIKEEIKKAWRFKQSLSLIFMDIDFFKSINDQHGHQIGDQILRELGDFVKKSIRDYDIACRFGGEEFVVLLPQTKLDNAYDLADRLRESISQHQFCNSVNKSLKVTSSFGVSMMPEMIYPQSQLSDEQVNIIMENIIAWADDALYQAKKAGRNRVISHPAETDLMKLPNLKN